MAPAMLCRPLVPAVRLAMPQVLGLHWFQWADEPATGRFDGEDSNWGLVTIADEPYPELTARMACVAALSPTLR